MNGPCPNTKKENDFDEEQVDVMRAGEDGWRLHHAKAAVTRTVYVVVAMMPRLRTAQ